MNEQIETDKNCLSYWYPKLVAAGIPIPRTEILKTDLNLMAIPYHEEIDVDEYDKFIDDLRAAMDRMGYPCFLRTGHTSAKHSWDKSCYIENAKTDISKNVCTILETSAMAMGIYLGVQVWCVREMLNANQAFLAFWGNMPIRRERRYFIRDGKVFHHLPYWPEKAFKEMDADDYKEKLAAISVETEEEIKELTALSERAGRYFEGEWSIDWMLTINQGWVCIDMAEAAKSWGYL